VRKCVSASVRQCVSVRQCASVCVSVSVRQCVSASVRRLSGYYVTVRLGNLEEAMSQRPPGQSISPMAPKTLYIGNREMSDKSRNE
jgi:hypothetical protein